MKDFLEDCYSLNCLAPQTERSYLNLDKCAFVYSCMITDEIYNYFKEDKSRLIEFLKDEKIPENALTDSILREQYYEVKYKNKMYILKYKEDSFRREVFNDYNIDVSFDIIPELCEVQDEFPYKWLQVGFVLERFDICEEDLEELK
jgi:hypothetical protein